MQVIAGRFRGRALEGLPDRSVRPATARVRQAVFDVLAGRMEFGGKTVLDLFAGTGSLGIEAISRGAAQAVFVERHRAALRVIERNLARLGCREQAEVWDADAMEFMERAQADYDLVFADPPYRFDRTSDIPSIAFRRGLVRTGGYLLIEHTPDVRFPEPIPGGGIHTSRKFGRTIVTIFLPRPAVTAEADDRSPL
ncbi:MAG: 16S rRNA (guanine(966)-N(2))-methyltransferase RsmD [Bacteroidota bacterium]